LSPSIGRVSERVVDPQFREAALGEGDVERGDGLFGDVEELRGGGDFAVEVVAELLLECFDVVDAEEEELFFLFLHADAAGAVRLVARYRAIEAYRMSPWMSSRLRDAAAAAAAAAGGEGKSGCASGPARELDTFTKRE
jgi:hypothetical protein